MGNVFLHCCLTLRVRYDRAALGMRINVRHLSEALRYVRTGNGQLQLQVVVATKAGLGCICLVFFGSYASAFMSHGNDYGIL